MYTDTIENALEHFYSDEQGHWHVRREPGSESLVSLMYEVHDGLMPMHWRFEVVRSVLYELLERLSDDEDADLEEMIWEISDGQTDIYNGPLWAWFTEDGPVYVDEFEVAMSHSDDFYTALRDCQFAIITQIAERVLRWVRKGGER